MGRGKTTLGEAKIAMLRERWNLLLFTRNNPGGLR